MKGKYVVLFVVVLFAFSSFQVAFTEARHKHVHHKNCHYYHVRLSPVPLPSFAPSPNEEASAPQLQPITPTVSNGEAPETSPPALVDPFPAYQVRDCGYGYCFDSNDCNPPCSTCCNNHTCCYDDFLYT
ncbi:unnamed protein product [Amaranthus hypochondriacus]